MSNTEQIITTGIGAAVGFVIGGPVGAVKGALLGYQAGALLFPAPLPDGPRLEDFEVLHADPGAPVMIVLGTGPVPGFRMYLGPVAEIATTEEVGKGGGPEQTTFTYFQTLGLGLCEGVISGIAFIYENGELVYDVRPQREDESAEAYSNRLSMSATYAATFVLYRGTETQDVDATMELEQGADSVPAFRGLAYMIYPNRELKQDQGFRHPSFTIGVVGRGELVLTSRPYPYQFEDEAWVAAMVDRVSYQPVVEEGIDLGVSFLGGELDFTLQEYENWPTEELDLAASFLSGDLDDVLQEYENWPTEELDLAAAILSGVLDDVLVEYENWPDEEIDVSASIQGGTLS